MERAEKACVEDDKRRELEPKKAEKRTNKTDEKKNHFRNDERKLEKE